MSAMIRPTPAMKRKLLVKGPVRLDLVVVIVTSTQGITPAPKKR